MSTIFLAPACEADLEHLITLRVEAVMGAQAIRAALADAHLHDAEVQPLYAGYVYGVRPK